MIGINKNIKWDSMIAGDWDVIDTGYTNTNWTYHSWCWYPLPTNNINKVTNGGQEGWTFASLTDAEVSAIMSGTGLLTLPAGTFPFINKILVPTVTTDAAGNSIFKFDKTSICDLYEFYTGATPYNTAYNNFKSSYTNNNGKLKVIETSVPAGKTNITHLVFVRGQAGNITTGAMTIDPTQFAAFTVGLPGSGADIIMDNTEIFPGKTILLGNTEETTITVNFATNIITQD